MENSIKKKLEKWVEDNYKQYATGWTYERSEGNCADCFDDGMNLEQAGRHMKLVAF